MKKINAILVALLLLLLTVGKTTAQDSSTDESDIRQKVIEKVQVAKNNPKAYLGTITDKTDDSMQIKNPEGEIQLLSIEAENASFVKNNDSSSSIKYSDLAIGDFIVAMGLLDDKAVLDAKRILVTEPPSEVTRKIIYGEIVSVENKQIELRDNNANLWILTFPKRWKGPDLDELSVNEKLIAAGEVTGNEINIRSIFKSDISPTPNQ